MRTFSAIAATFSLLLLGQTASHAAPTEAESPQQWSLSSEDDKIMVQTTTGLPVVLDRTERNARTSVSVEDEAESRAAHLTRYLDSDSLQILAEGTGPRVMAWDIENDAITDVSYRDREDTFESFNDWEPTPGVLGRSSGCTDSTSTASCLFHDSGNTTRLTGTNGTSNYTFLNVNMFAGPRDLTSQICAGSSNDCQGIPADFAVNFAPSETVYSVTHY